MHFIKMCIVLFYFSKFISLDPLYFKIIKETKFRKLFVKAGHKQLWLVLNVFINLIPIFLIHF